MVKNAAYKTRIIIHILLFKIKTLLLNFFHVQYVPLQIFGTFEKNEKRKSVRTGAELLGL
jgi:hypothetical protein